MLFRSVLDEWGNPLEKVLAGVGSREVDVLNTFTNHEYDAVLGVYYAKARFYDPELGRFLATDPMRQGNNWYTYVENNPIKYIDPDGMWLSLPQFPWDKTPWDSWNQFKDDLTSDKQGRDILLHWLYGNGSDFIRENNKSWAEYMTNNELLSSQIQDIVKGYMSQMNCGDSVSIDETIAMVIENGEQMIGYQYLHGTNAAVGGFSISGTIVKNTNEAATISLTCRWNDIIDPNFYYTTDSAKAQFANSIPFANPTDYIIRISWNDISTTDESGDFATGWLANEWEYVKNLNHNNVSPTIFVPMFPSLKDPKE